MSWAVAKQLHWAIPALLALALAVSILFELNAEHHASMRGQSVTASVLDGKLTVFDQSPDTVFYVSAGGVLLNIVARPRWNAVAVPEGPIVVQAAREGGSFPLCYVNPPFRPELPPCATPSRPPAPSRAAPAPSRVQHRPAPAKRRPSGAPQPSTLPVLSRRVVVHLRYTDPSVEADVALPKSDPVAKALLAGSLPLPGFLNYALSRAVLSAPRSGFEPILIAYSFPLRAKQIYVNETSVVVHAETSDASVQNVGLASILPVVDRELRYSVNARIDAYLRSLYQIDEEYVLTADEFTVVDSNAPSYVVGRMTGVHLVWERPPDGGEGWLGVTLHYPYLASFANFAKLAANGPSDYWPISRSVADDSAWFVRLLVLLVVAALVFDRERIRAAAAIPLALGAVPIVVALDANDWSGIVLNTLAIVGAALVMTAWARRRATFALPLAVGGVTLVLAAVAPRAAGQELFLPSTAPYFWLAAFAGAFVASALVSYYGVVAAPLRTTIAVLVVAVVALVTVPLRPLAAPVWDIVLWSRVPMRDLLHDLSTWIVWLAIVTTVVALCVFAATHDAAAARTGRARFFFCLAFVDPSVWWGIVLPIEVLGALLVFRIVWLPKEQRARIERAAPAIVADRLAFLNRQHARWDVGAARDALGALAARFRKSEIGVTAYETESRSLEGFARTRGFDEGHETQPLAIGPENSDVANGVRALWVGLAFGLADVLLGVPAIVRAFAEGTPRSMVVADIAFQAVSSLTFYAVAAFVFGYFFRFWRGSSGLIKGLWIGVLLVPITALGWYSRGVTPLQIALFTAETLAMYATIGLVFDYRSMKAALGWRFHWLEVFRHAGGPEFGTAVAALVAAIGLGIVEALRGEFSTLAKAAFTVTTGSAGGQG